MNTNYRSAPGAIALVNTLFGRKERPFGFSGMDFYPEDWRIFMRMIPGKSGS